MPNQLNMFHTKEQRDAQTTQSCVKNRVFFFVWIAAVLLLYTFGNEFGTRVVLYASIVVPTVLIILARVASGRIKLSIRLPDMCECGETIHISNHIIGAGVLPGDVKIRLLYENLFTGERWEQDTNIPHQGSVFPFTSLHCGTLMFTVVQPSATDMFGLKSWKINQHAQNSLPVMPRRLDVHVSTDQGETPAQDSDEYSMQRPGGDPGETFAIREYIPGDPLKSIHWKLSNKTDKLLVREWGLPIVSNILVLMETSLPNTIDKIEPKHIDMMARIAYSISYEYVLSNTAHQFGWLDTVSLEYKSQEVTSVDKLDALFVDLLTNTVKQCSTTAIDAYSKTSDFFAHSFVVVVGVCIPQDIRHNLIHSKVVVIDSMNYNGG